MVNTRVKELEDLKNEVMNKRKELADLEQQLNALEETKEGK